MSNFLRLLLFSAVSGFVAGNPLAWVWYENLPAEQPDSFINTEGLSDSLPAKSPLESSASETSEELSQPQDGGRHEISSWETNDPENHREITHSDAAPIQAGFPIQFLDGPKSKQINDGLRGQPKVEAMFPYAYKVEEVKPAEAHKPEGFRPEGIVEKEHNAAQRGEGTDDPDKKTFQHRLPSDVTQILKHRPLWVPRPPSSNPQTIEIHIPVPEKPRQPASGDKMDTGDDEDNDDDNDRNQKHEKELTKDKYGLQQRPTFSLIANFFMHFFISLFPKQ